MGLTSFHIVTFGCQMNKSDSERMAGVLTYTGQYEPCDDPNDAEVLIYNSCAIRENAENRLFSRIRESNGLRKKTGLPKTIILAGCVSQYEQESILKQYPYIDFVIGTNTIEYLPELISNNKNKICLKESRSETGSSSVIRDGGSQGWIPIMYGCNNFCSYCIVPYTRGREVSRTKESILEEVHGLSKTSLTDIMLLGQNVNSYGKGLYSDYDFADLLEEIQGFTHIKKIDFLTSHPKDITGKLIKTIAQSQKISHEIHFPIQAGDNRILKAMNRGYSYEDYCRIVASIREQIPDALISTDIIVGFPGETEEEFQNSIRAIKELKFFRVISSAFSPRKGTAAAEMEGAIDEATKHRRLLELQAVVKTIAFRKKPIVKKK